MKLTLTIASALASISLGSAAHGASIIGTIRFSSGPNGGVIFQDMDGNLTTALGDAKGVQSWLISKVDGTSDSFASVPDGESMSFTQPWTFNPSTPTSPLWTIAGFGNFAFNLSSATVDFNDGSILLISGTGTVTSTDPNLDPTPAIWSFATEGSVAPDNKYSWSGSVTAVPEAGTTVLLGGALLGVCLRRRRNSF